MTSWIRAIRNFLVLYAGVFVLLMVYNIPRLSGLESWRELSLCRHEDAFFKELEELPHVQELIPKIIDGYDTAPFRYVTKCSIKLDNGLKIFIIGMEKKNDMGTDWQILSIGDAVVYKGAIHRYDDKWEGRSTLTVSTISISDIHHFLPDISTLTDIVNSSEEVYDWIKGLPEAMRPFKFFYSTPDSDSALRREVRFIGPDWDGGAFKNMHSDFTYSTADKQKIAHEFYFKYGYLPGTKDFVKKKIERVESATYSFYRMHLDDHHVSDTEDVTAIIPEYYDW